MGVEIERKFLIDKKRWQPGASGLDIRQGYLVTEAHRTVRVRTKGNKGFLTIKGATSGISRMELEYEIPLSDAELLLDNLCLKPLIEKKRYIEQYGNHVWEIDVFYGDNEGLVVAEVELSSADEQFALPEWIGKEVSGDKRYYNACLVKHPYKEW
ncbi:CYTH domain-containing protein [uncultured Anaerovibrio sp.]|uniref:CYTH domain-containing protein n=1 Tax=uncultured Anaerovibrio sp. TaxID=361586 RepID=UPI00260C54AB|nr:CYTH domain-containing protein [uncultured Anaerovibrio sp.]